jgi:hypothetical protein
LLYLGDIVASLPHLERTIELYDSAEHRSLATRFGHDAEVHALCYRSWAFWFLGYPKAALMDAHHAVHGAREISQAITLMNSLTLTSFTYVFCGDYAAATAQLDEVAELAEEKGSLYWKDVAMWLQGWVLVLAGRAPEDSGRPGKAPRHLETCLILYRGCSNEAAEQRLRRAPRRLHWIYPRALLRLYHRGRTQASANAGRTSCGLSYRDCLHGKMAAGR